MSKRKATTASAIQPTPTVCPAWCDSSACRHGHVHETAEQHLPIAIGQLSAFLAQPHSSEQPAVVLATAQFADDAGRDFLEMTVDQAAELRDLLDQLIALAKPQPRRVSACWDNANQKRTVTAQVTR